MTTGHADRHLPYRAGEQLGIFDESTTAPAGSHTYRMRQAHGQAIQERTQQAQEHQAIQPPREKEPPVQPHDLTGRLEALVTCSCFLNCDGKHQCRANCRGHIY